MNNEYQILLQQVQDLATELKRTQQQLAMMTNLALASAPNTLVTDAQRQQAYNDYMNSLQQQTNSENNERAFK